MMNIASIEYGITQLQKVKETIKNTPEPSKYDMIIRKEKEILSGLTQYVLPNDLIKEMILDSNE